MRFLSLLLAVGLTACASMNSVSRAPSSDGAAGSAGSGGARGADGRAGNVVVAQGCEGYLAQGISGITSGERAGNWESIARFMCGPSPKVSPDLIRQAHRMMDEKFANLLAGSRPGDLEPGAEKRFEANFDGLKGKVALYGAQLEKLETVAKRDYGCRQGAVVWGPNGNREEMKICQRTDLDYINPDGTFTIRFDLEAFREDLPNHPAMREAALLESLPEACENGGLRFQAESSGSSRGKRFVKKTRSECDTFDVEYSSIYPKVNIRF